MKRNIRITIAVVATLFTVLIGGAYPFLARRDAWFSVSWQAPWFLFGLVLIIPIWYWSTFGQDLRQPFLRIGTIAPFRTGPIGLRPYFRDIPGILRCIALVLFILALARPVSILRGDRTDDKGIDIVITLDLSGSMRAVMDAKSSDFPNIQRNKRPTRLDVAKSVIQDFIGRRKSDRIGVVVFGTSAYVLSPPTLDYHLLSQLVSQMQLNVINPDSTAIGDALATSVARLRRSDAQSKVIVLLTDGDSNAGAVSPEYAAQLAANIGAKVYTIQIGSGDEAEVEDGVDYFGRPRYVRTKFPVNPELLQKISLATGASTYVATDAAALRESMHSVLNQLEKTRFDAASASFEDLFPFLLIPGALLIAIDVVLRAWLLRRFP